MALLSYTPGTSELVPALQLITTVSGDGMAYTYDQRRLDLCRRNSSNRTDVCGLLDRLNTLEGQVSGLVQLYGDSVGAVDELTVPIT